MLSHVWTVTTCPKDDNIREFNTVENIRELTQSTVKKRINVMFTTVIFANM